MTDPGAPGVVLLLLGLHLVAAVAVPFSRRWVGRRCLLLAAVPPVATLVWVATAAGGIVGGTPVRERLAWVPTLGLDLTVNVDAFALIMVLLVSGIGTFVFVYANSYFGEREDLGRVAGLLVGFSGAMLGLVVSDNVLAIFLFWEATSVTSYLLIGLDDRSASARAAALRALLTTGAAGLAMLAGLVLLGQRAGTHSLAEILADPPTGTVVDVAVILVLVGAFAKSAQFPFHYWLPGAMSAPTPVSAYLHSATMVKAGVYLIARLAPAFAESGGWRPIVITVGLITMLLGGWRALGQHDLKLLLAHGTTSQLGLMVVLLGAGFEEATLAGVVLLFAHGLFKATLFMVVGIVDHQAGSRDLRRLSGLHRPLRTTAVVALVGAASMAGLPPLLGFVAKEAVYEAFVHAALGAAGPVVLAVIVAGSALTFAYSARLSWGAFADKGPDDLTGETVDAPGIRAPALGLLVPAALLAVLSVVAGLAPVAVSDLLVGGARALDAQVDNQALSLWHGVNEALVLSGLTVAVGLGLWVGRRQVRRIQVRFHVLPPAARVFDRSLQLTARGASVFTGKVQTGSLPIYLLVILSTLLALPGGLLIAGFEAPSDLLVVDRPVQITVTIVMVLATAGAIVTSHRLASVLCIGAVGYGVAVLFVIQGAPDLALTQLLIETLVLVLFVLVLRHLPRHFSRAQASVPLAVRAAVALAVGAFMAVFALVAFAARPDMAPVSDAYLAQALPEADGRNVVNVILVDFRAFDTLGEIVVLTVTALGVIGLVRAARRDNERSAEAAGPTDGPEDGADEVVAVEAVEVPLQPSPMLDAAVQVLFRTVLLFSLGLLFLGHNHPGGGFIGGLVGGAAFILVYLAGGEPRLRRTEPVAAEVFLGVGLSIATVAGMVGWATGGELLSGASVSADLPLLGTLKVSTALVFDIGVYLVVLGLVMALLRSIGREEVLAR